MFFVVKEEVNILSGKVYIVGAGPGDPELLTVKASRVLKEADVILYDRLVNPDVLDANPSCELVYVGKEDGNHTLDQQSINELLLRYGRSGKIVVRLKGGDPFVFGRGGEEASFLALNDIPFEIIPGVTSVIGAPAYAGIPVTYRGISSSFAVITGHEAPHKKKNIDWESLKGLKGIDTLIFLMGVRNRREIAEKLIELGRNSDEPVAFIEKGSTSEQAVILSTLGEVANDPPQVSPPAVFLVGEVVKLRKELQWFVSSHSYNMAETDELVLNI